MQRNEQLLMYCNSNQTSHNVAIEYKIHVGSYAVYFHKAYCITHVQAEFGQKICRVHCANY